MLAVTYFVSWNTDVVRTLLYALLALVAAVAVFPLMLALMPTVAGCCAVALPLVGQLLAGAAITTAFAFVTKP